MNYKEIAPPPSLSRYVKTFWKLDTGLLAPEKRTFRLCAEGFAGLHFMIEEQEGDSQNSLYATTRSSLSVTGPSDSWKKGISTGVSRFLIVGVTFYPFALKLLFGTDIVLLTNQSVALSDLESQDISGLHERLQEASTSKKWFAILSQYLLQKVQETTTNPLNPVYSCICDMADTGGKTEISEWIANSDLSRRQFERVFKLAAGMSPHTYLQIHRFHQAIRYHSQKRTPNLAQLALDCGYYDQSHFNRDFKRFAGITPRQFFAHQTKADNFLQEAQ